MHVHRPLAAEARAHLADRLQERQRFDIADRAADLDHADVRALGAGFDAALDFVGDVRNHLHRRTQIIAATFLLDDVAVDLPGRHVAGPRGLAAQEAFVVAEIEIGFGTVLGNEHLSVLKRAHGARIDVDIGVQFQHMDLDPARFENRSE